MMEFEQIFTPDVLREIFPPERADMFFDGLYGDRSEGAYDIKLVFRGGDDHSLRFEFHLEQRPGKCLACNLTYGLPQVFSRHPVIDVDGLVSHIDRMMDGKWRCADWRLGSTREVSDRLHVVPLEISLTR